MKKILYSTAFVLVFCFCGSNKNEENNKTETPEQMLEFISQLETKLKGSSESLDLVTANALANNYIKFQKEFPQHEKTPYCLFEAAKLCMGIERPMESVEYFEKFASQFPENERVPLAIFLQGFIFENYLNDIENAKRKYEEYLAKYPQHEMTKDAEMALQNLGKSPEELIREFEAKEKEKI
ncbi:MAG: tetratricopeptide repeat protein [Flavobacteriales bacterium]|nr:tetratricopeptide repeat protein [Flavobacteriales bacterium]